MNKLSTERQAAVLGALVEGTSIRSVERMTGVHRDTIMRLSVRIGQGCQALMDERMRNLPLRHVEVDEIWSFVGKKQAQMTEKDDPAELGDTWTWVALSHDTRLVPSFLVGDRSPEAAREFMIDLAGRVSGRLQISADAFPAYISAIYTAFGSGVDFGQIVKYYETEVTPSGRYSPPKVVSAKRTPVIGEPKGVSTSYVERQNLSMRTSMKRMARLTLGFSKKLENHRAATGLYFGFYNFCRVHRSLRVTPAMAAGLENRVWSIPELIEEATKTRAPA